MTDDKKTLKFQMMMAPREAEVLDDWMFRNRIRSRAEAIRQLWKMGLMVHEKRRTHINAAIAMLDQMIRLLKELQGGDELHGQAIEMGRKAIESAATNLGRPYGYDQMVSSRFQDGDKPDSKIEEVAETAAFVRNALFSDYERIVADIKRMDPNF